MEKGLFQFIWKHSKRQQLNLLAITLATFPVLYISLELPKRIINDAIGGSGEAVIVLGMNLSQTQFLLVLCFGFLLAVLINGLLKMRLNTMKGVLAERLLRRFRFQLLTRIMRFPRPYFRKTSQGELVSMVTSEAEPMGGLMGDMLSQPVFQAGQMLTILTFLFAQSVWFGLASIALIPLQAWLIPMLQRQINLLNKARIQEVRKLASEIGETAAGVSDLRVSGGLRYRSSLFSNRLGRLFSIRFDIYQKKFFMKFLNNFINQLTPFFFYSVGGYLAIRGEITVGALVAALAAYKDLSSPWKELLAYYNQTQDMSLRWEVVTERFAPATLVDDSLFEGIPETLRPLNGDIVLNNVTVMDASDHAILQDLSITFPKGARVAVEISSEQEGNALAELLTREVLPKHGDVTVAGIPLNELHQMEVAKGIGHAVSSPHIFEGTVGENLMLPLKHAPLLPAEDDFADWQSEAIRSGNAPDPFETDWVDPKIAGLQTKDDIQQWWFELVVAMGLDDLMVRRSLKVVHDAKIHKQLIDAVISLRPEVQRRLKSEGLVDVVHVFHPDKFNPVSPLGFNLFYGFPTRRLTQISLSQDENFMSVLHAEGIVPEMAEMSATLVEGLTATFGQDGTDHPLFRRLNLSEELYYRLGEIVMRWRAEGEDALSQEDFALMLTLPFAFSSEQIGPAFTDEFKARILEIRKKNAAHMVEEFGGLFETLDPTKYVPVMSLMGNAIFGRVSDMAGSQVKKIEDVVVDVLSENGLRRLAAQSIYDVETSQGGENLPVSFRERISISRAGIKKPDILILENAIASHSSDIRDGMRERISDVMPDATKIFIESSFENPKSFDMVVKIVNGRIEGTAQTQTTLDQDSRQDLTQKLNFIAETDPFRQLDRKQQRLLAFSARWFKVSKDQFVFKLKEEADAAYICVKGSAGLYWYTENDEALMVSEVTPGRLIGDLAVIQNRERTLDLKAHEDSVFLRIGADELVSVIENDAMVAASLLRAVANNMAFVSEGLRQARSYAISHGIDFAELDQTLEKEAAK